MKPETSAEDPFWDSLDDPEDTFAATSAELNRRSLEALRERAGFDTWTPARASAAALDVLLAGSHVVDHSIDLAFLAQGMGPFQSAVSAVAQAIQGEPTGRAPLPRSVVEQTTLRLVGIFPGSCGLRFMGPKQDVDEQAPTSDSPGTESLLDQSLSRVLDVLDAVSANSGEEDALERLAGLGPRASGHMRTMAKSFGSWDMSARFAYLSMTGQRRSTFGSDNARQLSSILENVTSETTEVRYRGRLVGASLARRTFEFELADDSLVKGAATPDVLAYLAQYFDTECVATLTVTTAKSKADGTEALSYLLSRLD